MTSLTAAPARLRALRGGFAAVVVAFPLLLLAARALPATGLGGGVRIVLAAACVVLLPGAVVLRALAWPAVPALAVAGSFALSLGLLFAVLALTFLLDGTLWLTAGGLALAAAGALVPAVRARVPAVDRPEAVAVLVLAAAGIAFGGVVWWVTAELGTGDVLFHLGRARKLVEADALTSVAVANEFGDGGLHPGYAFPLWHAAVALVAQLAGVDVAQATLHLGAVLVPVALVIAYAAGRAVFGSWPGGAAVVAFQVAQLGFSPSGPASYASFAGPGSVTRLLLVPALIALAFAFLRDPTPRLLVPVAAAAFTLFVIHPTYLPLLAVPVAGFAALALALGPARRRLAAALAALTAAAVLPSALFLVWLYPTVSDQASHRTREEETARALAHYGDQLQTVGASFRLAPETVTRGGPMVIAAFLCVPLAALAVRRWWGAFAAGGVLLTLAVLLVPALFEALSDLMLVSQARRLAAFLPLPFVLAAAAVVAGRLRLAGVVLGLAAAAALLVAFGTPADAAGEPGPSWPLWAALAGGAAGLAGALVLRRRLEPWLRQTRWTAAVALALAVPVTAVGLAELERAAADDAYALTPGVVEALRGLEREDVVFASAPVSHRVVGYAPVYVAATIPHHTADTGANRPYRRQRDTIRFFSPGALGDDERAAMLDRYGADYVLVDKTRPYPREFLARFATVFEDGRYLLLRVRDL